MGAVFVLGFQNARKASYQAAVGYVNMSVTQAYTFLKELIVCQNHPEFTQTTKEQPNTSSTVRWGVAVSSYSVFLPFLVIGTLQSPVCAGVLLPQISPASPGQLEIPSWQIRESCGIFGIPEHRRMGSFRSKSAMAPHTHTYKQVDGHETEEKL